MAANTSSSSSADVDELPAFLVRLKRLLEARGTLCNATVPCRVSAVPAAPEANHSKSSAFEICLPVVQDRRSSGSSGTQQGSSVFCEVAPTNAATTAMSTSAAVAQSSLFLLKKACAVGRKPRCFLFELDAIRSWSLRLKADGVSYLVKQKKQQRQQLDLFLIQPAAPRLRIAGMARCAVVMSGHSLRCPEISWASRIDNRSVYGAVFRANLAAMGKEAVPPASGSSLERRLGTLPSRHNLSRAYSGARVDYSLELRNLSIPPYAKAPCELPEGAQCLPSTREPAHPLWRHEARTPQLLASERSSGLGLAHTGGAVLSTALAFCNETDVYGMGMFSEGPGHDVLYQHFYDSHFAPGCKALRCWRGEGGAFTADSADGTLGGGTTGGGGGDRNGNDAPDAATSRDARFFRRFSKSVCRPHDVCGTGRGLPQSENPDDFFFRSELRLYVLHALGLIRWVWY